MRRIKGILIVSGLLAASTIAVPPALANPKPPKEPAKMHVRVSPETVAPGGTARVELQLEPVAGVKINRYPQVRLRVKAVDGLASAGDVRLGDGTPPPPGETAGYYESVEPLRLELTVDSAARRGRHELDAMVNFVYCMPKKGFCAPVRRNVRVPLTVR